MTRVLTLIVLAAFAGATSACENGSLVQPRRTTVALIFSDVTSSLVQQESKRVAALTADVLDALPPGTNYAVYPIQMETQRLAPIREGTVTAGRGTTADLAIKQQRREELDQAITELYEQTRKVRDHGSLEGRPDNHSCILNSLTFAEQQFRQFADRDRYDLELIFISDMIEECNRTPMRRPITLAKKDISKEIKLAETVDLSLNLSAARVTMIIPSTMETYRQSQAQRPDLRELQAFWKQVMKHCGFDDESLLDDKRFYFSSGLPQRFKPN